ncbi:transcription termination/antitermination protein NusG [Mycoplasmopsis pullorum]|uniref:Transcription termination/antitermination protein NusG n=1 Tax=Mycoplasmopsis pullorum TaxID=48003 RepID=A0A1L4FS47_9BACT|nr:transcription termination/antitermination protein NusG [Mycoplasmopsis pullorum]APJ38445.1 transcription termination/antitermination protein NusG [Mycoplasmopsis pullorum]
MKKFNWYMVSTISGKESFVVESLKNRIFAEKVEEDFDLNGTEEGPFKIFQKPILTAKEAEKRKLGDSYKIKWVNMYPGYIFIKMHMSDQAWFVVRNTQYVTGLVGSSGKGAKPTPVTEREIKKSWKKEEEALQDFRSGKSLNPFKVGDVVEVVEGSSFVGERGILISIDEKENTGTIEIESFGKKVPVTIKMSYLTLLK